MMEIGLYTFADVPAGKPEFAGQRLRNLVEEMELADQVGLDVFAVGEHHRADYAVSSPAVALGSGGFAYQDHSPVQCRDSVEFR